LDLTNERQGEDPDTSSIEGQNGFVALQEAPDAAFVFIHTTFMRRSQVLTSVKGREVFSVGLSHTWSRLQLGEGWLEAWACSLQLVRQHRQWAWAGD